MLVNVNGCGASLQVGLLEDVVGHWGMMWKRSLVMRRIFGRTGRSVGLWLEQYGHKLSEDDLTICDGRLMEKIICSGPWWWNVLFGMYVKERLLPPSEYVAGT